LRIAVLPDGSMPADLALCLAGDATPDSCAGCQVTEALDPSGTCAPLEAFLPAACPPGFAVDLANAPSCVADPSDCSADAFAGVEDGDQHWFVDPAYQGESTGKRAAPFASLGQALKMAEVGSTIALAAGTHALPKGETTVAAGVALVGRCAALTSLQLPSSKADTSLIVQGLVEGVSISGGSIPLVAQAGGIARRVAVGQGSWAAVRCGGCTLDQAIIGGPGRGIAFDPGAATLHQVRIHGAVSRGLELASGVTVALDDVAISATQPTASSGGYGILASDGAKLTGRGLRISGSSAAAVAAYHAGTSVILRFADIIDASASIPSGEGGHGLLSSGGALVSLSHGRLKGNQGVAALSWGQGSQLKLVNTAVLQTLAAADQGSGDGARAQNGGQLSLRAVLLQANRTRGVLATGAASQLDGQRLVILDTLPRAADLLQGFGILVDQGATAFVDGARLQGNRSAAALVTGKGSQLTLQHAVLVDTLPRASDYTAGYGVEVASGGRAVVQMIHVARARTAAMLVSGEGSQAQISQAWLTETQPRASDGRFGRGLVVASSASVAVSGLGVFAARDVGVSVTEAALSAQDLWISHTQGAGEGPGRGLDIAEGGSAKVSQLRLSGHLGVALSAAGTGTAAEIAHLIVDASLPSIGATNGGAVQVSAQAKMALRGFRLDNLSLPGLLAADSASRLDAIDGRLDSPALTAAQRSFGAVAVGGATLTLTGAALRHCRGAGVMAENAKVELNGVVVSHTTPLANGSGGAGLHTHLGHALLWGSQLTANRGAALAALGSQVELHRCAATATLPLAMAGQNETADGLLLIDGLESRLKDVVIAGHPRAGLVVQGGSLLAIGLALHNNGFAWCVQGLAQLVTNTAVILGNLQNVWTGPALPWNFPPQAPAVAGPCEAWSP
jgi:hypothetical protein